MKNLAFTVQGIIQVFVALGAIVCGILLMLFPSGAPLQMPEGMLRESPFHNFLVPGVILFLVNGIGQLLAGVLTFRRHPAAGYTGAIFGIGLMIWIFVQVNMIGGRNILQYSYFTFGVLETALSFFVHDRLQARAVYPMRTDGIE